MTALVDKPMWMGEIPQYLILGEEVKATNDCQEETQPVLTFTSRGFSNRAANVENVRTPSEGKQ